MADVKQSDEIATPDTTAAWRALDARWREFVLEYMRMDEINMGHDGAADAMHAAIAALDSIR